LSADEVLDASELLCGGNAIALHGQAVSGLISVSPSIRPSIVS
jgi:hypothetical protein